MGIKIDSNQKIWYVNYHYNNVVRIDYNLINGDINSDGNVNVTDVVALVFYILDPESTDYLGLDINDDGNINVSDVVQLVNIILN